MKPQAQTDTWISRVVILLIVFLGASVAGTLIRILMGKTLPEALMALGFVAAGGLIRLLISPLNARMLD